jgi:hypothetical protein
MIESSGLFKGLPGDIIDKLRVRRRFEPGAVLEAARLDLAEARDYRPALPAAAAGSGEHAWRRGRLTRLAAENE